MVQNLDVCPIQKVRIKEVMEQGPAHEHETQMNFQASAQREHHLASLVLVDVQDNFIHLANSTSSVHAMFCCELNHYDT